MIAIFALAVSQTQNRMLAMILSFVLGFVVSPIVIASNTVVHQVTSSKMSGKVFAALEFVMHLSFLVAMLGSSWLAEHVSRAWILASVGGIFLFVGGFGLIKFKDEGKGFV